MGLGATLKDIPQPMKMEKTYSSIHSELVLMTYSYKNRNAEKVMVFGQFNDWGFEGAQMDIGNDGETFTYSKMVAGGQIYNFYLFVDGKMTIDDNQKKSANDKFNWMFVPLSENNTLKASSLFKMPFDIRLAKMKKI